MMLDEKKSSSWSVKARLPEGGAVSINVSGTRIASVDPVPDSPETLPYALPVLVDLQQNGAMGAAYNLLERAEDPVAALTKVADHLRRHGVGRCLMTITTYPAEGLQRSAALVNKILSGDQALASLYFGIFHEGVFISPREGWRGAQAAQWVLPPDFDLFRAVDDASGGRIKVVNVAPEEPGGLEFVEKARAAGKRVAIGHACPEPEIVHEAIARGATMVTHFGNGAAPMIHRFKNPFWSFLSEPALSLGLICDGFHLPPEVVKVALACKGRAGCMPVSDASGYSGMPPGEYTGFGGRQFVIRPDGFMHVAGKDILSGSWFQADRCVEFLTQSVGMPFLEAWEQCSVMPARAMGMDLPDLTPGADASFVLARWDDGLLLEQSVHLGERFLDAPTRPCSPPAPAAG